MTAPRPQSHYTSEQLVDALETAGIQRGDTVLVYASLGRLGYSERGKTMLDACTVVDAALRSAVGDPGTLLIPTYTYSIGRREVFDVEQSPSTIGDFTEYMRTRPGAIRSADPMLAVTGTGPRAAELFADLPHTCFGAGCLYARLDEVDAKICMIGLDLHWATYRHYIEAIARVPFRFAKKFDGVIRQDGKERRESWIYHAAPRLPQCAPNGAPLGNLAKTRGLSRSVNVGRGSVTVISCREYFALGLAELHRDPWFAAAGPALSLDQLLALEDARVGATAIVLPSKPNATSSELLAAAADVPRWDISDGADAVLHAIAAQTGTDGGGWTTHRFPSGTSVGSSVVPEKWTCLEACIETEDGKSVFSTSTSELRAVPRSLGFNGVVTREVMLARLRTDSVPRLLGLGAEHDWELACSEAQKAALQDARYRVRIHAESSFGALKAAERIVGDPTRPTVVLCAAICPQESGEDLGGLAVMLEVVRAAAKKRDELGGCLRFVAAPNTMAVAAWLTEMSDRGSSSPLRGALWLETGASEPTDGAVGDDEWSKLVRRAAASVDARALAAVSKNWNALESKLSLVTLSLPAAGPHSDQAFQQTIERCADLVLRVAEGLMRET